jgi:5-methylcytosine-specific restriction endonuclease McrA
MLYDEEHMGSTHLEKLWKLHNGICALCGERVPPPGKTNYPFGTEPTADHIIPVAKGGTNALANKQLAHYECNNLRGHCSMENWPAKRRRVQERRERIFGPLKVALAEYFEK